MKPVGTMGGTPQCTAIHISPIVCNSHCSPRYCPQFQKVPSPSAVKMFATTLKLPTSLPLCFASFILLLFIINFGSLFHTSIHNLYFNNSKFQGWKTCFSLIKYLSLDFPPSLWEDYKVAYSTVACRIVVPLSCTRMVINEHNFHFDISKISSLCLMLKMPSMHLVSNQTKMQGSVVKSNASPSGQNPMQK